MSSTRYGAKGRVASPIVHIFTMVNLAMALAMLVAWPYYGDAIAEPMSLIASLGTPIRPSAIEYPFIVFWLIPLFAVALTYVSRAIELNAFVRFFAIFPTLLAIVSCGWLYFYAGYSPFTGA